ncbi:MAG: HRDC domain-containing protein [Candidatus Promineifilaceae bacterium]|nr:HRDC domain-containing protein [Candidatus Promineifilaceae bacterium]
MNLPPHIYVASATDWQACLARLKQEPRIAIDLEANSLYAYRERICLIQISVPNQDYIIDPTLDLDLSGLGALLADAAVQKVFHAAEYDLILMKKEHGWQLNNLFDTMWAARILGYKRFGLANMLEAKFDVKVNKKYQKANWCKRPLSPAQLSYAQADTHYLLALRDMLAAELAAANREAEAAELFAEQTEVEPPDTSFHPDDFWSINGVQHLNRRQQAVARALNVFRDQQARRKNRPPFKIFGNRTLLELARRQPEELDSLADVHGMSRGQLRRYGQSLLKVIASAQHDPLPKRPPRNHQRPSEAVSDRYDRLHTWRKRTARARGVESDVILSRDSLWELARKNPHSRAELAEVESLGPWRLRTYGSDLIELLKDSN